MTITLQGSWTLRVKARHSMHAQRFVVEGAVSGNGIHEGETGNAVFVTGPQWTVKLQSKAPGEPWRDADPRLGLPTVQNGLLRFDITSGDELVLGCSLPASESDYVVYGAVKTYSGSCCFNPGRDDYIVIDTPATPQAVCARYPQLFEVIGKLYPERLRDSGKGAESALATRPLVIPTGLPNIGVGLVFQSRAAQLEAPQADASPAQLDEAEALAVAALRTSVRRASFQSTSLDAGVDRLAQADLGAIADIRDAAIRFRCEVERAPGLLLRFQRYQRSAIEQLGGPYSGQGARQDLGLAVTDSQGNYIFHFTHAPQAARPDLIVQVLGTGLVLSFETAPYDAIANLRRIDVCAPLAQVDPLRAGNDGRVFQRVGDVAVPGASVHADRAPTLDADGRVMVRNGGLATPHRAGLRGALRLHARFGSVAVARYAVFFKRLGDTGWQPVNETHSLDRLSALAPGGTSVGPVLRKVVPGCAIQGADVDLQADPPMALPLPTYANCEHDTAWRECDLKLVLHSELYRRWDEPGTVQFRIEGYDDAGSLLASDEIALYLDDRPQAEAVKAPSPDATVPDRFFQGWHLDAVHSVIAANTGWRSSVLDADESTLAFTLTGREHLVDGRVQHTHFEAA